MFGLFKKKPLNITNPLIIKEHRIDKIVIDISNLDESTLIDNMTKSSFYWKVYNKAKIHFNNLALFDPNNKSVQNVLNMFNPYNETIMEFNNRYANFVGHYEFNYSVLHNLCNTVIYKIVLDNIKILKCDIDQLNQILNEIKKDVTQKNSYKDLKKLFKDFEDTKEYENIFSIKELQ